MQDNKLETNGNFQSEEFDSLDFESLLTDSLTPPARGSLVKGRVVKINEGDVLINFGYKTEGVAETSEFIKDGKLTVAVGDEIDMLVASVSGGGGSIKLSKKTLDAKSDWDNLKKAENIGKPINVKIEKHDDNGNKFIGRCGEIEVHILDHQIDHKNSIKSPDQYIGKTFECKLLKSDPKTKTALASRRMFLIESHESEKKAFFDNIKVGDTLSGVVKSIKDYGVFVNLGVVDGFLGKDNISYIKGKHPSKSFQLNDNINVVILNIDKEKGKIEVGYKQLFNDPWDSVVEKYTVGENVSGRYVARRKKGYIVEVEEGVDAFIPEEELSWIKGSKISLEKNDIIEGRLIDIDNDNKKLVISVKILTENPWKTLTTKHPEGSIVRGKIKSITDFGMFIDFGYHFDGLVRKSDISWIEEVNDLRALYNVGDEVDAKIIKIDEENERIGLGIKQLDKNPWKEIDKLLPQGKVIEAPVTTVTKESVEVELPQKIKGVITQKELDENRVVPADVYKVGDIVKAVVLKIDTRSKIVLLSIKKYKTDSERREVKEYLKQYQEENDSTFSIGNLIKDKNNL